MNAKYTLALILALQVSMSLCDVSAPPQDLVDKYNDLKSMLYKLTLHVYGNAQSSLGPFFEKVGNSEHGQVTKAFIEDLQTKPEFQTFTKLVGAIGEEVSPLVEKYRTTLLGLYAEYLRPHLGGPLDQAINDMKEYVNKIVPAE